MFQKKILFVLFAFMPTLVFGYVDLELSYTYSERKIDGVETDLNPEPGSAVTITQGYSFNWAWYIWEYTALELNYSETNQKLVDDRQVKTSDDTITIKQQEDTVITQVSGVGIRQAFAGRKARIIPSLALGYAQYTTSGTTNYLLDVSGTEATIEEEQDKEVFSSSYAAFSLRFKFTQLMGLTLSAKTVMPEFDTSVASDNVTYSAGFSWMF
ncbi:MAG: hypothetical protein QF441_06880 [Bacteriovoracaceae bacterium]|jgi:hypothetical protein|nr:hypothetical protein [Halobacteriovoraceae bacterium]MDP7320316.1 hypothetical protein [Bacteriovoracaceae bacterium]